MTETTNDTKTDRTTERWICLGRRWSSSKNKMYTMWRDSHGEERFFAKFSGHVGNDYTVTTQRGDDGGCSVFGDAVFAGRTDEDDAQIGAWRALDQAAYAAQQSYRLEQSAKRRSEVDDALTDLLAIASKLPGYGDRDALARYVTAKIHSATR
jgi:hypothetical protein